jgi:hypothetical protein
VVVPDQNESLIVVIQSQIIDAISDLSQLRQNMMNFQEQATTITTAKIRVLHHHNLLRIFIEITIIQKMLYQSNAM